MSFPTEFDPTRKQVRVCEVCGQPASSGSRCTNGRCAKCHAEHCTPGGVTSPGHGRGAVSTPHAISWFRSAGIKVGTMDERCANCNHAFGDHYNGRCPAEDAT